MTEQALGILNTESLNSSLDAFKEVPGNKTEGAIQIITDNQEYNQKDVLPFISNIKNHDYHVISIFGSQSSGKSTLLNNLFNTKFQTMDEQIQRRQTTKGIWLSKRGFPNSTKNLLIMDVEGSDGVEKSDDKDFERKACLFALSSSEVLIINVWEHQIGLYQGNNMELLKLVFEVNLQLFHSSENNHKVLLLFVIRDHIKVTPLNSLKETMCGELNKMWEQIKKPEGLKDSDFRDFFDLEFKGFSHYFLQKDQFIEDCESLRTEFDTESIFENEKYKLNKSLPLDGWELYSQNCWKVISNSEQLDLPTQQILVAKFKTKEISNELLENYKERTKGDFSNKDFTFNNLSDVIKEALEKFDHLGGRYEEAIYNEERANFLKSIQLLNYGALENNLDQEIHDNIILNKLQSKLIDKKEIKACPVFVERCNGIRTNLLSDFLSKIDSYLELSIISESNHSDLLMMFQSYIHKVFEQENKKESLKIIKRINKDLSLHITDYLEVAVCKPDLKFWDELKNYYEKTLNEILSPYYEKEKGFRFPLAFNEKDNREFIGNLAYSNLNVLKSSISDMTSVQKMALILEEQYKGIFLIDPENQAPRFFDNMSISEMEKLDVECKSLCEEWLETFSGSCDFESLNKYVYGDQLDISLIAKAGDSEESDNEENDEELLLQKNILTDMKKTKIIKEFSKKIYIINLQTKRTILQSRANTKIPGYIYILLLVLGYSKILYILKNPLWIISLLLLGTTWLFVHKSGQYHFVFTIAQRWSDMVKQIIIEKLKDFVNDGRSETTNINESNTFEMQDLAAKEKSKEE